MSIPKTNPYGKSQKSLLQPVDFDKLIFDQGIRVLHSKTTLCPNCFEKESGHYDINCTLCDNGRFHFEEKEVWVFLSQKHMEQMIQLQGVWELGDLSITFPAYYIDRSVVRVDYFDKITILDFSERTSDLVKRSASGDTDKIRYEVTDVDYLATKNKRYYKDTDFIIKDTNINWINSNRPGPGEIYTLSYMYRPVYRIVNFLHEQRYYYDSFKSNTKNPIYLPIQAQARRDYIIDSRKGYN